MGILSLLPVLGIALLYSRRFGVTHSVALLHAVSAIVLVLYVGGLFQLLWWTALVVHVAGFAALVGVLWLSRRDPVPIRLSMPIAVLVSATILFWLVHGNNLYVYFDEYSHWGVYIKEMLALDAFWGADTNSMHPRYPPAAPLWQYLFNVFREPREGTAYVAQFVLLITPLLVLFEKIEWRRWYWALPVVAITLLALTNFGLGISSLYVDHVIGAWFAGIILCFVLDSPTRGRQLVYALPVGMLALMKGASLEFALAAAAIAGCLIAYGQWRATGRLLPAAFRAGGATLVMCGFAAAALLAWKWHLDAIDAPTEIEPVSGIVAGLTEEDSQADPQQGPEITRRFLEVFMGQQIANDGVSRQFNAFSYGIRDLFTEPYRLSTFGFLVLYTLWWIGLLVLVLRGETRARFGIAAVGIGGTGAAYIFALYLVYRFAAGDYGLELSSYMRYVHTITLPMLLVSFAPLLPAFREDRSERAFTLAGRRVALPSVMAISACVALYVFETPYLRPVFDSSPTVPLREQLEPAALPVRAAAGGSRVWVYLPNDYPNGFIGQLLQYLLVPTPAHVERDPEFLGRDMSEVMTTLADYEYVWVAGELQQEAADRFVEISGQSLDNRLFVVEQADGKVRLEPASVFR